MNKSEGFLKGFLLACTFQTKLTSQGNALYIQTSMPVVSAERKSAGMSVGKFHHISTTIVTGFVFLKKETLTSWHFIKQISLVLAFPESKGNLGTKK